MSELALKLIAENKKTKAPFLDLGNCGLVNYLPDELLDCVWLEGLNLGVYYRVESNKKWIETINKEEKNTFTGKELTILEKLTGLQSLDLRSNQISDIHFLKKLSGLQSLHLGHNQISDYSLIQNLTGLRSLDLSVNEISDIRFIEKLTGLQSLDLSYNQIRYIGFLEKLTGLKSLELNSNQISNISFLSNLTGLQSLNLNSNKISDIRFLENLTGLQLLDLSYNKISDISLKEKLTGLKSLDLSFNEISDISLEDIHLLTSLSGLQSLILCGNQISDIHFLSNLNSLIVLDLSKNKISDIGFLEKLEKLEILILDYNQIIEINFELGFKNLRLLSIKGNKIFSLNFLNKLDKLQILDFSENQVSDTGIGFLEKYHELQHINISRNNLVSYIQRLINIPVLFNLSSPFIVEKGTLDKQFILEFYEKQYTKYELKIIKSYFVSEQIYEGAAEVRDLEKITSEIGVTRKLSNYLIDLLFEKIYKVERITNPPLEIVKQGREAIINWFEESEIQGEEVVYEAKLMIIGDAGSGKTSLSSKIKDIKSSLPNKVDDTTVGIDISEFEFKQKEDKPDFKVNIWDLGGQKIYHPLHQLFFSRRSLYVLVVNGREENDLEDFWIPVQKLLGKDSPMLILFNQHGNIQSNIPFRHLRVNYPNIKGDLSIVDLLNHEDKTKDFISEIEKFLRNLPQFEKGEKLPKLWVRIREAIAQKKENYFDLKDFRKLCSDIGIKDPKKQDFVSDYLHDLGIILRFRDDALLNKIVFLKPQWALDAIYRVLDHTREHQNGLFRKEELFCVWDNQEFYDAQDELLALMKKFELCYEIDSEQYLVPSLLPEDLPTDFEWDKSNNITLHYEYDFMPKGIISRLIVRLHHLIAKDKLLWREGVIFEYQGATVWLTKFANKRIELYAIGYKPSSLITIITNEIDEINSKYQFSERSKPSKKVPCICDTCSEKSVPIYYSYDDLILRDRNGKKTVECTQVPFLEVNVKELIENVKDKSVIKSKNTIVETMKSEPIKIFVTYCWTDKDGKIDEEHQNKVHGLVNALRKRGFNATFDMALNDTCTANDFMRMMVENIDKSDKVIVLLSEGYAVKAKDFKGGVGDEYQLLINDLNENVNKYIFATFVPRTKEIYPFAFKGRDTIDLSKLESKEIENLIRKLQDLQSILLEDIGNIVVLPQPIEVPPLF